MKFINKHKGKIFLLIFIFFTAFTIYDTYSMENQAENEIKRLNRAASRRSGT